MTRVLLLALLSGCSGGSSHSATPADAGAVSAAPVEAPGAPPTVVPPTAGAPASASTPDVAGRPLDAVQRAMGRHDEQAERARAAVVAGDLPTYLAALSAESTAPLPGDRPELAASYLDAVKAAEGASDLQQGARGVGRLGAACATCHATAPGHRYPPSGFESESASVGERMMRHWWSVEALWQGLVDNNDTAWAAGASSLAATDLTSVPGFPEGTEASVRAARLREAAAAAAKASGPPARGEALGDVLATCAACHEALGGGPGLEE